jgi:tetratricopeptide (TPR) repeat protein
MRSWLWLGLLLGISGAVGAQQETGKPKPSSSTSSPSQSADPSATDARSGKDSSSQENTPSFTPPRSDRVRVEDLGSDVGQSSSKDTQVDLSPPEDDAKKHPQSSAAVEEAEAGIKGNGVTEFHTWDPHKAAKSIEVGDFYYKRKNYKAAEERYREALRFKDNDAVATIRLAICLERLGVFDDARSEYESYLKILPHGPESDQAQKAIERLKAQAASTRSQ